MVPFLLEILLRIITIHKPLFKASNQLPTGMGYGPADISLRVNFFATLAIV